MQTKYYRVKKDTDLWREGAIISDAKNDGGYLPIEDIWTKIDPQSSNGWGGKSRLIVESPMNEEWYERVYKDNVSGMVYRTADQMRDLYQKAFK